MKFRFLGDGDCPDWLLAEINRISRVTSIKIKILAETIVKYLTTGEFEEQKISKITQDAKLEHGDAKAVVAALEFILTSSARYGVCSADLNNELQQLGLPREHSAVLARIHTDYCQPITVALSKQSLRVSRLTSVTVSPCISTLPFHTISIQIEKWNKSEEDHILNISHGDLRSLIAELKTAKSLMEAL